MYVHLIHREHTMMIFLAKILSENNDKVVYYCFPRSEIRI